MNSFEPGLPASSSEMFLLPHRAPTHFSSSGITRWWTGLGTSALYFV